MFGCGESGEGKVWGRKRTAYASVVVHLCAVYVQRRQRHALPLISQKRHQDTLSPRRPHLLLPVRPPHLARLLKHNAHGVLQYPHTLINLVLRDD